MQDKAVFYQLNAMRSLNALNKSISGLITQDANFEWSRCMMIISFLDDSLQETYKMPPNRYAKQQYDDAKAKFLAKEMTREQFINWLNGRVENAWR